MIAAMRPAPISALASLQRLLAAALALALALAGLLPALHHHDSAAAAAAACHDSRHAAPHLEALSLERHEPCGLCAKIFSPGRLEQPAATLAGILAGEAAGEHSQLVPSAAPGRHGASRAPPRV